MKNHKHFFYRYNIENSKTNYVFYTQVHNVDYRIGHPKIKKPNTDNSVLFIAIAT